MDVADEVCIDDFPVFWDPVFRCEKNCACALYLVCIWSYFSNACAESSEFVCQGASAGGALGAGDWFIDFYLFSGALREMLRGGSEGA